MTLFMRQVDKGKEKVLEDEKTPALTRGMHITLKG